MANNRHYTTEAVMSYIENALEVQLGGAHGVSGQEVHGLVAVLVARIGDRAVLEQHLGVLGALQHAREMQRGVASRSLQER